MAHYKEIDKGQGLFLTINLSEQLVPGTYEYTLTRLQIIEPVFADITYCKGIMRFTLRSQKKVMIQWILYCLVHNIGKCNKAERPRLAA